MKKKKQRAFGSVILSGLFLKKFVEVFNMGSSFEDLDVRNPMMKTVQDLDAQFMWIAF